MSNTKIITIELDFYNENKKKDCEKLFARKMISLDFTI